MNFTAKTIAGRCIALAAVFAGSLPFAVVHAAMFSASHAGGVTVGAPFEVDITLDTANVDVNAVQGDVVFPTSNLSLQAIIDGASPVSLWVEPPKEIASGTVHFSGIIPGGITGMTGPLLTLILVPTAPGNAPIAVENTKVLANDGQGTALPVTTNGDVVAIGAASTASAGPQGLVLPHSSPAPFTPVIESDPNVYDGRHFLVFGTTDKGSGMNHYEVTEVAAGGSIDASTQWNTAVSPYLLQDQSLGSDIYVRAVNNAGNGTLVKVPAEHPESSRNWAFEEFAAIAIGAFLFVFFVIRRGIRGKQ